MGVSGCSVIHMYLFVCGWSERNAIAKSTFLWPGTAAIFHFFSQEIIKIPFKAYFRGFVVFPAFSEGHFRLDFQLLGRIGKNRDFCPRGRLFSSNLTKKTIKISLKAYFRVFVVFPAFSEGHFPLDFRLLGKNGKNRQFLLQRPTFLAKKSSKSHLTSSRPFL